MTVVEKLKRLSNEHAKGVLTREEFEARRFELLNAIEEVEEAPPPERRGSNTAEQRFEPGVTLALVALGSIMPGLLAMLFFGLPLWSGATIFAASLGGLTWLWSRSLGEDDHM